MSHKPERTYPIHVTAFEGGILLGLLWKHRKKVPNVVKQLLLLQERLRDEAGVEVKELEGGLLMLRDRDGNVVVREKHPWEA